VEAWERYWEKKNKKNGKDKEKEIESYEFNCLAKKKKEERHREATGKRNVG